MQLKYKSDLMRSLGNSNKDQKADVTMLVIQTPSQLKKLCNRKKTSHGIRTLRKIKHLK